MHLEVRAKPLDRFPAIRSKSPDEVEAGVIQTYGARRFSLAKDGGALEVRANHWQSQNVALSFCSYGARVQVDFPGADFFRQQFCLTGSAVNRLGQAEHPVTKSRTCVVPPKTPLHTDFHPGFEQLVLRIDTHALLAKLAALLGKTPRSSLEFLPETHADNPRFESFRRRLAFFVGELETADMEMLPSIALTELEQMVMVSFLCFNPNNHTELLERQEHLAESWLVRRAEEYIETNWDKPIKIEELARATSASARSIFYHFKRSRGHSPMDFVKQVRLLHARQMLTRSDKPISVTEAAFACGFVNLGHFAKDYLKRFGEKPSDTLKRGKA